MVQVARHRWHFQDRTDVRLRFFFEILAVNGIEVMSSFVSHFLFWFIVFLIACSFFKEIAVICCGGVKAIALRIFDLFCLWLIMWIRVLSSKLPSIGCESIKRLFIGYKLAIFVKYFCFGYTFGSVLIEILGSWGKGNVSIFVFDPGDYFLSHCWFMSREVFSIFWVDIWVGYVRLCFYIKKDELSEGGFFQVLIGFLTYSFWYVDISEWGMWI